MEQRLFIAACIMFVFKLLSKYLFKKNKLSKPVLFALWHSCFLILFLGCLYSIFSFVLGNGDNVLLEDGVSKKDLWVSLLILLISVCGFFYAKAKSFARESIQHFDIDWADTISFAGFVASFTMFFFIQAFKIPSASMYNTLQIGDHLFVNKTTYGFRIPLTHFHFGQLREVQPDDVIIFSFPAEKKDQINCGGYQYGRDYVKRVVAVPGDIVEIKDGDLYINHKKAPLRGYEVFRIAERLEPVATQEETEAAQKGLTYIPPVIYQTLWEGRQLEHELGLSLRDNFGPVTVPAGQYFVMGDNRDDSCDSRFWGAVPFENIKGTALFIHWPLSRIQMIH